MPPQIQLSQEISVSVFLSEFQQYHSVLGHRGPSVGWSSGNNQFVKTRGGLTSSVGIFTASWALPAVTEGVLESIHDLPAVIDRETFVRDCWAGDVRFTCTDPVPAGEARLASFTPLPVE